MIINERKLDKDRVRKFLELTGDNNPIHQEPENVLPGMFYLALSAPCLYRPLVSLDLKFKNISNYPSTLFYSLHETGDRTDIKFSDGNKDLCHCSYEFFDILGSNNKGLEEFARVLQVPENNPNLRRIFVASTIPHELLKHSPSGSGYYLHQTLRFLSPDLEDLTFNSSISEKRKSVYKIDVSFAHNSGGLAALGKSTISFPMS